MVPCLIRAAQGRDVRRAFLLRTDANEEGRGHHPRTIVEIACDVRLRDFFDLRDGDAAEIEIEP
jgi:riboflavin kinase, archaea type